MEIVPAASLAAQRIADFVHAAQVDDVVPLLLERLEAVLAHVLKNHRKTSLKKNFGKGIGPASGFTSKITE